MYSPNPANRLLIVGSQLLREGEQVAPGVRVEEIRADEAVLSFQGQRFRVRY